MLNVGLCNLDAVAACREIRTLGAWVPEWISASRQNARSGIGKPGVVLTLFLAAAPNKAATIQSGQITGMPEAETWI
jgi:hypothetical protein